MHLIGRSIRSYGVTPANDTIPFIDIPMGFSLARNVSFSKIVENSKWDYTVFKCFYDNTINNPENPNNPPQPVYVVKRQTKWCWFFSYTYYLPGDENVILDTNVVASVPGVVYNAIVSTPQLYTLYPNPSINQSRADYYLPIASELEFSLIDLKGAQIWNSARRTVPGLSKSMD